MNEPREFTCAMCGETFEPEWSEAEAQEEYAAVFPGATGPTEVVCDDCWNKLPCSKRADQPVLKETYE